MSESIFDIPKPTAYSDKWLLFNDTILSNLDIADCNDTINGICYTNKTIEKCIEECENDKTCDAGYFIKSKINNYCVPLNTDQYTLNPVHKLRKKQIYPVLNDLDVTTFINSKVFPFPPDEVNVVFYNDIVTLVNSKNGFTPSITSFETRGIQDNTVKFDKYDDLSIQLRPSISSLDILLNSSPIQYGDEILLIIPGKSLIMTYSDTQNTVVWSIKQRLFSQYPPTIFKIIPTDDKNQLGDVVKYGDKFSLNYQYVNTIYLQDDGYLDKVYGDYKNKKSEYNAAFSFRSKMNGYYCDNSKCKTIQLEKIEKRGKAGRYKGRIVSRNAGCYGMCNYKNQSEKSETYEKDGDNKPVILYITGLIILIIFFIIIIVILIKIRNTK
jgi:hypothetical protein